MTFSLIGRSKDGTEVGVAVASKFLAIGSYVPAASADAGALATQAFGNMAIKTKGLELLREGASAAEMLEAFLKTDPQQAVRQIGVVSARGDVTTYTGDECTPWAGGKAEAHPLGSYAAQGNCLSGPEVVDAMVETWLKLEDESNLAVRLVKSLEAGEQKGGDPRGKQAAAVLVVSEGKGYLGLNDVKVDLRVDDSAEPIGELLRLLDLHDLYFGETGIGSLLPMDKTLTQEVKDILRSLGFASGDLKKDLYNWMGRENYEMRWHDGRIDPIVLEKLREAKDK